MHHAIFWLNVSNFGSAQDFWRGFGISTVTIGRVFEIVNSIYDNTLCSWVESRKSNDRGFGDRVSFKLNTASEVRNFVERWSMDDDGSRVKCLFQYHSQARAKRVTV